MRSAACSPGAQGSDEANDKPGCGLRCTNAHELVQGNKQASLPETSTESKPLHNVWKVRKARRDEPVQEGRGHGGLDGGLLGGRDIESGPFRASATNCDVRSRLHAIRIVARFLCVKAATYCQQRPCVTAYVSCDRFYRAPVQRAVQRQGSTTLHPCRCCNSDLRNCS